ncbi:SDR family NAD(P)-dependent oxidoreductase [Ferrovibrio sp.]|uniref:SDR family NAD(P)-dependent oxidoreductase n=1 Tax=Ferrovibrio sp. TaxID=1917215 RepID=UPI0035B2E2EB
MDKQARSHEEVALICGGTAGIGLASARALLDAGLGRVMLVGRNPARGAEACALLKQTAPTADIRYTAADLARPEQAAAAVTACIAAFGRIDTLLSGAGGDPLPRLLHETPLHMLPQIIGGITSSVLLPVHAALPHMMEQKSGTILCIASDAGKVATPGEVCIGAAMAAIAMFCRALAIEAKRSGIRVNCITPSIVRDTPLYHTLMADPFAGKLFAKAEGLARLGVVCPQDLADLIVFLSGPSAARLTGQTISVNGGISAA